MSFWEHIKPAVAEPSVTSASLGTGGKSLQVGWSDGQGMELPARFLRQQCPCATCVDEWTQKRTFDPALIKPDMTVTNLAPVGNYALRLQFADGHQTGIFPWKLLRELGGSGTPG